VLASLLSKESYSGKAEPLGTLGEETRARPSVAKVVAQPGGSPEPTGPEQALQAKAGSGVPKRGLSPLGCFT
jgi:hypothetical protein